MRWIVDIAIGCLRSFVFIVARFLRAPFIASTTDTDLFGLWSRIFTVPRIFRPFDLGLATAAVDFVGEFAGSDDRDGRKEISTKALVIYTSLGIVWGSAQLQQSDDFPWIIVAVAAALANFLKFAALRLSTDERACSAAKSPRIWRDSLTQN